jgi:hypothetical protein
MQLRHVAIQKKLRYMFREQNTSLMLTNYIILLIRGRGLVIFLIILNKWIETNQVGHQQSKFPTTQPHKVIIIKKNLKKREIKKENYI